MPDGLEINAQTGEITGTPTCEGTYRVTIIATNSFGTGLAYVRFVIKALRPNIVELPEEPINATLNAPFSYQISADNDPTRYRARGLPRGMTMNPKTGEISGKPKRPGVSNVIISASNRFGTDSAEITIQVGN